MDSLKEQEKHILKMEVIIKVHLFEEFPQEKMGYSYIQTVLLNEEMSTKAIWKEKVFMFPNKGILDTKGNGLEINLTGKVFNIMVMDQSMREIL